MSDILVTSRDCAINRKKNSKSRLSKNSKNSSIVHHVSCVLSAGLELMTSSILGQLSTNHPA